MRVAFNLLKNDVLSLLSPFSSIKLILSADDYSRQEYILYSGLLWVPNIYSHKNLLDS